MSKTTLVTLLILVSGNAVIAQATWNQDVAAIVYEHCGKCHHNGGIAPFSLITYDDASGYSEDMLDAILEDEMPPWGADPNYTHFLGENVLSVEDMEAITDWVENGAPEGTGSAPPAPTYSDGYQLAAPDEIIDIPYYEVSLEEDEYRTFVIPSTSAEDRYIGAIEFEPGNTAIVHHVLFWYDPTNESQDADDATPEPGFQSSGGAMSSDNAVLIGGWVPGAGMVNFPQNLGMQVPGNSDWVIEVHYAPGSTGQTAPLNIRLQFKEGAFIREVWNTPWLYHFPPSLQEGLLIIPANTTPTFHEVSEVSPIDLSVLSLFPHMHLLGQTFKVYALTEEADTIRMIDVNNYDFHWQYNYTYPTLLKIPEGSVIYGEAMYDNTENNEENPNDPPQLVTLGEGTTDEMMICFFTYTYYLPGDENLSLSTDIEEVAAMHTKLNVWPNPATEKIFINLPGTPTVKLNPRFYDSMGKRVNPQWQLNGGIMTVDVQVLPAGCYSLSMDVNGHSYSASFIRQ
ncbi:MAG: hypothetical protein JNM00_13180 [Flavobacteriales bacterium]|nr:hypothetical protein [Flavobacteriales bacterium]